MDSRLQIGRRIRSHREGRGITRNKMARDLGLSVAEIESAEERGELMKHTFLVRISDYLDVEPAELFQGLGDTDVDRIGRHRDELASVRTALRQLVGTG